MRQWFAALPIHRKLIAMALAVSTTALLAAVTGLVVFDVARFRTTAVDDAQALAQLIAENAAAAIVFDDEQAAREMLGSLAVRPVVSRACVYRVDGTLLAGYSRSPDTSCPDSPSPEQSWRAISRIVPVSRNERVVGAIYVERQLSDLPGRVIVTATAGVFMLLIAAGLAFGLARQLQQVISRPIVALAIAARAVGRTQHFEVPPIPAAPDETGELVNAFSDMVQRLVSANEALKVEVEQRRRMQEEREDLLAREREASRLKDEFLAAVSHELRTPLNAILGWTQVLASTKPNRQTINQAIESLSRNAQAQNRVIEDLLDVSRIITGKLQLVQAPMDLRAAVKSAVEVIVPLATAKSIVLSAHVPEVSCPVHGDPDRLRQILWNLLSNAVKFTPRGGAIKVTVALSDATVSVVVTDTGIGIAQEFLPHVFERFRQADGSTTREHGGLGLGLAIVKELVELHGGTVRAASPGPGRGATFTITLRRLADVALAAPDTQPVIDIPGRLDGIDVLAVDDNDDALRILAAALTNVGALVRTALSVETALDEISRKAPDVVLCDLAMPGADGFEMLRKIRALENDGRAATPVIAVTAYASEEYRERCRRAGFQGHVPKPYITRELVLAVASAIRHSSEQTRPY